MKIKLSNCDKYTLIDDGDLNLLPKRAFYLSGGYVCFKFNKKNYTLHRFLIDPPKGLVVDHINQDKLDNRRSNLRICRNVENIRNRKIQTNNNSGIPGVTHRGKWNVWRVRVKLDGIRYHIGDFKDLQEAGYVRDQVALQLHGKFAKTYTI